MTDEPQEHFAPAESTEHEKTKEEMEEYNSVLCSLCGKRYNTISPAHLRNTHSTSMKEYRERFPNAELVNQHIKDKIAKQKTGVSRGESFSKAQSERRKGKQPDHLVGIMSKDIAKKISRSRLRHISDADYDVLHDKNKLEDRLLKKSLSLVAEDMGVSTSLISKQCSRLGIKL